MRTLLMGLAVVLSGSALAGQYQDRDKSWWLIIDPPASIFSEPGLVPRINDLPRPEVAEMCEIATGKSHQFGCVVIIGESCDVYVVKDLPSKMKRAVTLHEVAHCHNWHADHPVD